MIVYLCSLDAASQCFSTIVRLSDISLLLFGTGLCRFGTSLPPFGTILHNFGTALHSFVNPLHLSHSRPPPASAWQPSAAASFSSVCEELFIDDLPERNLRMSLAAAVGGFAGVAGGGMGEGGDAMSACVASS